MKDFTIYTPTRILFGKSKLEELPEMLNQYHAGRILALYDEEALENSGAKDSIIKLLEKSGIPYITATGVRPNPRVSLVRRYVELARKEDIDFILAIGGGSTIDTAKAVAAGVKYKGDIWECFQGNVKWKGALPVGVILTLPASGSETNGDTVILNEETYKKRYINSEELRPRFAILNPELTYSIPKWHTACGVADIISHLMERYFTVAADTDITDRMIEGAIRTMLEVGPKVLESPDNYELRAQVMWTGTLAEHGILNAGNQCDSPCHLIGHELGGFYDLSHGATLTIVFPAWMKYIWKKYPNRIAQFASEVMEIEKEGKNQEQLVWEGIEALERFFKKMGLPVRLSEAKIGSEKLGEMAKSAMENREYIGAFGKLQEEDVKKIFQIAI